MKRKIAQTPAAEAAEDWSRSLEAGAWDADPETREQMRADRNRLRAGVSLQRVLQDRAHTEVTRAYFALQAALAAKRKRHAAGRGAGKHEKHELRLPGVLENLAGSWKELRARLGREPKVKEAFEQFKEDAVAYQWKKHRIGSKRTYERRLRDARARKGLT